MDTKNKILEKINYSQFYGGYLDLGTPNDSGDCLALCPFHQDKNPSLSVNTSSGLYNCFACKKSGDVFTFRMEKENIDFSTTLKRFATELNIAGNGNGDLGPMENAYTYRNAEGNISFQACRFPNKEMRFRRPDGNGGWIWDLKGAPNIPYNLNLIKESTSTVLIAEGEKDCDFLVDLGLVATTNRGGGGNWKADINSYFQDRDVVILPDNDAVGRDHAQSVASHLCNIANSIKIVNLPGLKPKGDVSDFMNGLKGSDERKKMRLLSIVASTAEWIPGFEAECRLPT